MKWKGCIFVYTFISTHRVLCHYVRSGLFKATWIEPDMWQDQEAIWPNSGVLTWSTQTCSTACLIENEDCIAFRLAESSNGKRECQMASMPAAIDKLAKKSGRIKIWYSGEIKPPCPATYVYSVGHDTVTRDPIIVSDPSCVKIYEIPPVPSKFPDNIPTATSYRGGVFMFGPGSNNNLAHYWLPGEPKWSDWIDGGAKRLTNAVSIRGDTEVVALCSRSVNGGMTKNIAHYNGTLLNKQLTDIPEKTNVGAVVAWDETDSFYVFGGKRNSDNPNVFKYESSLDTWTQMTDMPSGGGAYPSCGFATYNDKPSVICMGTETNLNNDIDIFDLQDESWTTKTNIFTLANPPTYGSLVFSRGNKLYRVRGFDGDGAPSNSFDILNLDTLTWDPPVALEPSDVTRNHLVLIDTD